MWYLYPVAQVYALYLIQIITRITKNETFRPNGGIKQDILNCTAQNNADYFIHDNKIVLVMQAMLWWCHGNVTIEWLSYITYMQFCGN